jgi:hypothetical protein
MSIKGHSIKPSDTCLLEIIIDQEPVESQNISIEQI